MVLLSSFLFFYAILKRLLLKSNKVQDRVNRYLMDAKQDEKQQKKQEKPKFSFTFTKKQIRKKVLTKEKNVKLEAALNRAGLPLKPEEYIMFQWIAVSLCAGLFYLLFERIFLLPVGAMIGYFVPKFILLKKQRDRLKAFNDALPEMITTLIGGLRAGFSFQQGLKSVMEEAASPMKEEVEMVLREMQYGASVEDSLNRWKDRMPSEDLDLMIQAIIIQRQVGGNLATVLEKIVETIRARIKIQGQISTLTAQGRLSGLIVGLLPVILGFMLYIIEPNYIGVLFEHPFGIILMVAASISSLLGFIFIKKVTTIEV
nr:type II secretion system F family protein [Aquibacillus albus]